MDRANLQLLRLFRILMAERSVSRAALRAGMSQPATSHALGRLRSLFNDPLLIPSRDGMVPTSRAAEIDRELEGLISRLDRLITPPDLFRPDQSQRNFVVSATEYSEFVLLPKLIAKARNVAPNIRVDVRAPNQEMLFSWLESGEIDLRIAWLRKTNPALKARTLFFDQLVCIVRQHHPEVRQSLTLEKYLSLSHARASVIGRTTIGQAVDEAVQALGGKLSLTLSVPNFLTIPYVVAKSDLIATVPRRMADAFAAHLPLQILPLPMRLPRMRYCAYWHSRSHADAGHKWFRQLIAEVAKTLDG